MTASAPQTCPRREVHHADALVWLREQGQLSGASVVTSLPDVSELPALGMQGWLDWFENAALTTLNAVSADGVAIFFQSDIVEAGRWIDKGQIVQRAAECAAFQLLFHTIVCRKPAGTWSFGRPSYSHLLGFARQVSSPGVRKFPRMDVLPDAGFMPGSKAMGVNACVYACQFITQQTTTRTIVDPFCGWGTVLAVANALGLDAVGVDLSVKKCRRARALQVDLAELRANPGRAPHSAGSAESAK